MFKGSNNMKVIISKTSLIDSRSQSFPKMGYNDEGLYLFQDSNWNDYGYSSHFKVFYYHPNLKKKSVSPVEIGWIKLCPDPDQMSELYKFIANIPNPETSSISLTKDIALKRSDKVCSCPFSLLYYFELYEAFNDIELVKDTLKLLGDVTQLSDKQLSSYKENGIFKNSILRDDRIFRPNMIIFTETINRVLGYLDNSEDSIKLILNFYEVISKTDLKNVKKICADLNKCNLSYNFLAPLIDRVLEAIEEKNEINDKDLCFYELKYSLSDHGESNEKDNLLLNVLQNIIEIKKALLFKWDTSNNPTLGHYTSMKTVPKLISFGKDNYFRFTSASQLNDPLEGKVIFDFLNQAITTDSNNTNEVSNHISSNSNYTYFIASATTQSDSLPMWKQYTENADGVYMTFSDDYLMQISQIEGMRFGKICYLSYSDQSVTKCIIDNKENQIVTNCLNNIFAAIRKDPNLFNINNGLITRLTEISFLFKRYEYSYENEIRIFIEPSIDNLKSFDSNIDYKKIENKADLAVVTEDDGNPIPRLRIAITACPVVYKSIKLGPKAISRDYVEPYVKACYQKNQVLYNIYPEISIDESSIQYR